MATPQVQKLQEGMPTPAVSIQDSQISAWQDRLLPLMRGMIVLLTGFFLVVTFVQAYVVQERIYQIGREDLKIPQGVAATVQEWNPRVSLEVYAIRQRYQHNAAILMSRTWIIYLGFVTGMILALIGAVFVLGKVRESTSELTGKAAGGELSFKSASPGLVLSFLGTTMMICTMAFRADVAVQDAPLYYEPETTKGSQLPGKLPQSSLDKQVTPGSDETTLDKVDNALNTPGISTHPPGLQRDLPSRKEVRPCSN